MLNLKFADMMELTEVELQEVRGGLLQLCDYCGGGMGGLSSYTNPAGAPSLGFLEVLGGYFDQTDQSDRRRH
ncbi:hypothetical protein STRDD10_01918 [Streptococcus sp. DD10]|uniref:hypothetical protein n=1 Tax=Streptococcus sp. DD10 TaxID=1777878 RepID=UPI00079A645F|nr:hypothetical protein [Streptococcus sp. DD10]KXT72429.1 hypothetical protein STRDD10_01918 [Streptococcus sp. DD10]